MRELPASYDAELTLLVTRVHLAIEEDTMSAHTITTPEQEQVLRQAATLSRMLQQTWSRADSYDVVMQIGRAHV